jgi:hypothetical protein
VITIIATKELERLKREHSLLEQRVCELNNQNHHLIMSLHQSESATRVLGRLAIKLIAIEDGGEAIYVNRSPFATLRNMAQMLSLHRYSDQSDTPNSGLSNRIGIIEKYISSMIDRFYQINVDQNNQGSVPSSLIH